MLAATLGGAVSVNAAVVSYSFGWSEDASTYTEFTPSIGTFTTESGKARLTLPASVAGITLLSTTAEALSGKAGSYFDVKQGDFSIAVDGALWAEGTNPTGGHVGLFGVNAALPNQVDYYWHTGGSANVGHAGYRDHGSDDNGVASSGLDPAYPKGDQAGVLTISYDSDTDTYLYNLAVGGTLAATRTVSGVDFDGRIDSLGLRYGANMTQNPNSYAEFGDVTISGYLVPEPSAFFLGSLGGIFFLLRRRR